MYLLKMGLSKSQTELGTDTIQSNVGKSTLFELKSMRYTAFL